MNRRWLSVAVSAGIAAGMLGGGGTAHAATVAASADPAQNVPPSPAYWSTCTQAGAESQTCIDAVVAAIDNARSLEGVGPMVLPAGFASLAPAQQTFVVSNLERVDRGLPPVAGMVDSLDTTATAAAVADDDPRLSSWTVGTFQANAWSSIWAGDLNPLAADYDWMYNDGWGPAGSYNLDCQSATASGCWGHRHAILRAGDQLVTGVGVDHQSGWTSIAQIFVAGTGSYPAFTYSWADVTGDVTPPTPAPTAVPVPASVRPNVDVQAWGSGTGSRTVVATITPARTQPVRLRRHTSAGWVTVRRATAAGLTVFHRVQPGSYRLIVSAAPGLLRSVTQFSVH